MKTESPASTDAVPLCLVVPLMRVADGMGTNEDWGRLEEAAVAFGVMVPTWLATVDEELAKRVKGRTFMTAAQWDAFLSQKAAA